MSDSKKFIKGIVSGYSYLFFSLFISLWLVPFVLKYLTKPEYGIFAIATDLLGWLSIANLGITAAFNSKGAQLLGSKNYDELNEMASTTFFTQLFSTLIILIFGIAIVNNPDLIFGNTNNTENIQIVVALLILSYIITYALQPLNSLLVADKQIHIDNYLKFGLLALRTTITVVLLINGFKLMAIAISSLTATIVISIVTWIRVNKQLPFIKFDIKFWKKRSFSFLIKNGVWFTIGGIAGILIFKLDSFLIGKYISLTTVTSFVITLKLYQITNTFHAQFFNTSRPYFAQVYGKKDMNTLSKMYNIAFYTSFASAFIMGITVFLLNKWFIGWWVGPNFYLGDTISLFMCVNFILQAAVLPNRILLATTLFKIKAHNLTRIFEGLTKFLLSVFFIHAYGLIAILLSSIFASLLFSNTSLNIISSKLTNDKVLSKLSVYFFVLIIPVALLISGFYFKMLYLGLISLIVLFFVTKKASLNVHFLKIILFRVLKKDSKTNLLKKN